MAEYLVVVLDPKTDLPQIGVEVEARSVDTGAILDVQPTNLQGLATFDLDEDARYAARSPNRPHIFQFPGQRLGGSGPFEYDYLVDKNWATVVAAGDGTEGQEFETFHGHAFKVYSTLQGALDDINSDDQNKFYSISIVPGTYTEQIAWPTQSGKQIRGVKVYGCDAGGKDERGQVQIGSGQAVAINLPNVPVEMHLENIVVLGSTTSMEMGSGETGLVGHFINCHFSQEINISGTGVLTFDDCTLNGLTCSNVAPEQMIFDTCLFDGSAAVDFSAATTSVEDIRFISCRFPVVQVNLTKCASILLSGNTFTRTDPIVISSVNTIDTRRVIIVHNNFQTAPVTGGQTISVTATATGEVYELVISDNSFPEVTSVRDADTCYIRLTGVSGDPINGVSVIGNSFGHGPEGTRSIEDQSGFTVIGDWVDNSLFGPNTPVGEARYKITNGTNNLFIPESADETGLGGGSGAIPITTPSLIGAAPDDAEYLVLAAHADLTDERVFTPGTGLSAVDSGAGAAYTLNHDQVATGDLHTEYALLAGRAGGQTLIGGTAAGEDLTLQSTSHATKGSVFLGSSALFELDETTGQLKVPTTGSGAGLLVGGDVQVYRSAANTLRLDSGVANAYMTIDGTTQTFGSAIVNVDFLTVTQTDFRNLLGGIIVRFSDATAGGPSVEFTAGTMEVNEDIDISGHISIGNAAVVPTDGVLLLDEPTTITSGAVNQLDLNLDVNPGLASSAVYRGLFMNVATGTAQTITGFVISLQLLSQHDQSSQLDSLWGATVQAILGASTGVGTSQPTFGGSTPAKVAFALQGQFLVNAYSGATGGPYNVHNHANTLGIGVRGVADVRTYQNVGVVVTLNRAVAGQFEVQAPNASGTNRATITEFTALHARVNPVSSISSTVTITTGTMLHVEGWPSGPTYTNGPYVIFAGAALSGTPKLRLDNATPGANQTALYLAEGVTPTLRRVQWKDGAAIGAGDRVMVLV